MAQRGWLQVRLREQIAIDVLRAAIAWEPEVRVVANVTASELASLAAASIDTCPGCGATAFVNIDCDLCLVCSSLIAGEVP
jgi:predicted signal transduction protein with EAL and GGDEF domain